MMPRRAGVLGIRKCLDIFFDSASVATGTLLQKRCKRRKCYTFSSVRGECSVSVGAAVCCVRA